MYNEIQKLRVKRHCIIIIKKIIVILDYYNIL